MAEMDATQKLRLHFKKLALFFSPNPLWVRLHAVEKALWHKGEGFRIPHLVALHPYHGPLTHKINKELPKTLPPANPQHYHLRISAKTIEAWRSLDSTSPPSRDVEALTHLCTAMSLLAEKLNAQPEERAELGALIAAVTKYKRGLTDPDVDLRKMLKILGMKAQDGFKTLDRAYQNRGPLLTLGWYPKKDGAKEDLRKFGGIFKTWIRRGNGWFQCMAQVRYDLDVLDKVILRSKLHVPNIRADELMIAADLADGKPRPQWAYDGVLRVVPGAGRMYWMFEKRRLDEQDFFFLVTGDSGKKHEGSGLLTGLYLTSGQDTALSPVGDDVVMKRMTTAPATEKETLQQNILMKTEVCEVLETSAEFEELQACLKAVGLPLRRRNLSS